MSLALGEHDVCDWWQNSHGLTPCFTKIHKCRTSIQVHLKRLGASRCISTHLGSSQGISGHLRASRAPKGSSETHGRRWRTGAKVGRRHGRRRHHRRASPGPPGTAQDRGLLDNLRTCSSLSTLDSSEPYNFDHVRLGALERRSRDQLCVHAHGLPGVKTPHHG